MKHTVHLRSVGNPDYRQDTERSLPGVPALKVAVASLAEASEVCRAYITQHDLGGGNWSGGQVYRGNKQVARVSYNGRVWDMGGKEIEI